MAQARSGRALLGLTILAAPGALAFETLLRKLLFPVLVPEFELIREFFAPMLTPVAYVVSVFIALFAVVGLLLQKRMSEKRLAKLPEDADRDMRFRAILGVFLLTSSVPQIPTILSTFAYMFGASLVPVLIGIGLCSLGVVAQAVRVTKLSEPPR
ncbi:MAG: hypothetical protein AB8I08_03950 [Sandaracinaceae bacterium]